MAQNKKNNRESTTVLRVIDANYNRAKEAIRVCEDIARFQMEDSRLTSEWKRCRHHLTSALKAITPSYRPLLNSRESSEDVGKNSVLFDVRGKTRIRDLLLANMKRSQEALRVLEEFSKVARPKSSKKFQTLRFCLYDLEKKTYARF